MNNWLKKADIKPQTNTQMPDFNLGQLGIYRKKLYLNILNKSGFWLLKYKGDNFEK